jgi:hypothetical protein
VVVREEEIIMLVAAVLAVLEPEQDWLYQPVITR